MTVIPDITAGINLILCIAIFLLGYAVYRRQEKVAALLTGIAFGLFGLTHFSVVTGIMFPAVTFILLRICGYVLVAAALWLLYAEPAEPCRP